MAGWQVFSWNKYLIMASSIRVIENQLFMRTSYKVYGPYGLLNNGSPSMINTTSDTIKFKMEKFILVKPFNGALLRSFGFLYIHISACARQVGINLDSRSWTYITGYIISLYVRASLKTDLNRYNIRTTNWRKILI